MCSTYKLATVNGLDMRSVYNCATDKKSDVQQTLDTLHLKYRKLLEESHKYSTINRRLSDEKIAESEIVLEKIKHLESIQIKS